MTSCVDALGPDAVLCSDEHCAAFAESSAFVAICDCIDWQGQPIPDCTPKDASYPVMSGSCFNPQTGEWQDMTPRQCAGLGQPWIYRTCYCCCEPSRRDAAAIAVPEGERPAADVGPGDPVMTAARTEGAFVWSPAPVTFAQGDMKGGPSVACGRTPAVRVGLAEGATVVAPAQLLLTSAGTLRRADRLRSGIDEAVAMDGRPLTVTSVERGSTSATLRRIAVGSLVLRDLGGGIDGHLIARDGIVVGDYVTELYQHTDGMAEQLSGDGAPA
jgi:hypothetical protein